MRSAAFPISPVAFLIVLIIGQEPSPSGAHVSLSVVLMRHQLFVTLFRRASRRDNAKLTIEQEEVVLDLSESALGASEIYKKLSRKKGVGPLSKTLWINQFFAWLISSPMAHQLPHGSSVDPWLLVILSVAHHTF